VQDCLDLLANLVRQNSSNQSLFRESGCVPKLSELLKSAYAVPEGEDVDHIDEFPNAQRDKNLWGLLAVIRLFLVSGSPGTQINQKTFEKHGLLQQVLNLAFRTATDSPIRAEVRPQTADCASILTVSRPCILARISSEATRRCRPPLPCTKSLCTQNLMNLRRMVKSMVRPPYMLSMRY
jgi:hypothetical protein